MTVVIYIIKNTKMFFQSQYKKKREKRKKHTLRKKLKYKKIIRNV